MFNRERLAPEIALAQTSVLCRLPRPPAGERACVRAGGQPVSLRRPSSRSAGFHCATAVSSPDALFLLEGVRALTKLASPEAQRTGLTLAAPVGLPR